MNNEKKNTQTIRNVCFVFFGSSILSLSLSRSWLDWRTIVCPANNIQSARAFICAKCAHTMFHLFWFMCIIFQFWIQFHSALFSRIGRALVSVHLCVAQAKVKYSTQYTTHSKCNWIYHSMSESRSLSLARSPDLSFYLCLYDLLQFPMQYFHLNAHSIYTLLDQCAQANLLSFVYFWLPHCSHLYVRNGYLNFNIQHLPHFTTYTHTQNTNNNKHSSTGTAITFFSFSIWFIIYNTNNNNCC